MPSALETLVKILKLERQQGYKDTAVIGGLGSFSEKWSADAHAQARKPDHHVLVDELTDLLRGYEQVESKSERHTKVSYMLERITGRLPAPPEYQGRAAAYPPAASPSDRDAERPAQKKQPQTEPKRPEGKEDKSREERAKKDTKQAPSKGKDGAQEKRAKHPPRDQRERRLAHDAQDHADGDDVLEADYNALDFMDYSAPKKGGRSGKASPGELDIRPQPRLSRPPRKPRPPLDPQAAADVIRGLNAPVSTIKGVGPRMARLLNTLGIETINDMLFFRPRRHDDYTQLTYISKLQPNTNATVIGTVQSALVRAGKNNRKDFLIVLDDGSAAMQVVFFAQHWLVSKVKPGQQLVLRGMTSIFGHQIQMVNPELEHLDAANLRANSIVPVYPLTQGLGARELRRLMKNTVEYWAERLPDYVPVGTLERAELADLGWAVKNLHFPDGQDHLAHAQKRLAFDELLLLQLSILGTRREWQSVPAQPLNISDDFLEPFIETVFPYALTGAQRRAVEDIRRDVRTTVPMNRLLQGDVGAGKTAVAVVALAMALSNGKQSALMAPTSILAEQHYRNISAVFERMPGEQKPVIGLLTSALSSTEREAIYNGLADGSIDIIIGTHALIQEGVQFKDLAIAIIDEQHRFGVEQRGALRGKGTNPHLLVMTATPIPRTLALTMYADLDLTILEEKPPGRRPVQTRIVLPISRERVYQFVEEQVQQGRQAFVVHPLVEASDKIETVSAIEAYEQLKSIFFRYKVGLLHGRMKPAEKDEIMSAFSRGEFDILATTSVAEVGVDIPNASVMVIEGANRFGLSQLHQFRGRVGRGEHASYCLLIPDSSTSEAMERLQALESTDDGFALAEIDWKLRGPGDLMGTRQSGRHKIQMAEEMTPGLVELAQREARTIYADDPTLSKEEHRLLAQRVMQLYNPDTDVS